MQRMVDRGHKELRRHIVLEIANTAALRGHCNIVQYHDFDVEQLPVGYHEEPPCNSALYKEAAGGGWASGGSSDDDDAVMSSAATRRPRWLAFMLVIEACPSALLSLPFSPQLCAHLYLLEPSQPAANICNASNCTDTFCLTGMPNHGELL